MHRVTLFLRNNIEKVSPYLRSRCKEMEFRPIEIEEMKGRLEYICGQEHVEITPSQIDVICEHHKGDLRNAINALQAFHTDCPIQHKRIVLS